MFFLTPGGSTVVYSTLLLLDVLVPQSNIIYNPLQTQISFLFSCHKSCYFPQICQNLSMRKNQVWRDNFLLVDNFNVDLIISILYFMSVKVGVRVRPFNKREEQLGAKLVVQMEGKTTHLIGEDGQKKSFHYDYSFWSHDSFQVDEQGYTRPIDDKYADQHRVYEQIGSSILVNAWQGYNCCLFAYGQTGSGKSYSMIGYGANRGLIPIVCNSIFQKIKGNQDGTRSFEVKVSMMEIYNQAVRDLLTKNKKSQLKICEHKTLGVYVEGLQRHSVDSYDKIQNWIDQGSNNRSIAATLMNESSSRSHTIVSINFVQKIQVSMDQTSVKYSVIHLVDLAGSECVAKTGADSKDRLRETAKINQSLTTLGRVIEILAENCNKKEKDKNFVPYRDSKLTFILRNALGGNSQTAMICAISPADDNYDETLSTLRYASRAKKIQNKAIVNQSDVDKLIRLLRQENQTLKKMLQQAKRTKAGVNQQMISGFNQMNKNFVELGLVNDRDEQSILGGLQEDSNFAAFNRANTLNQSVIVPVPVINENLPYLTNVSEDQLLSLRIKYSCQKLLIGNKQGNPRPDVLLASLGIQPNHALITYDSETKKCWLQVLEENASNYTYVNGLQVSVKQKEELFHLDRIIFGTGCVFLLMFKLSAPRAEKPSLEDIDYQFALNERQTANPDRSPDSQKKIMIEEEEIRKKLLSQIESQFEINKREKQQLMKKQIQDKERQYQERLKEMQAKKALETQQLMKELQQREEESKKLQEQKQKIKSEVEKYLSKTEESNQLYTREKQALQSAKKTLDHKMHQIAELEHRIIQMQAKTEEKKEQVKFQLKRQQQQMKRDLEVQNIFCHNENVINQYKNSQNKLAKHSKDAKEHLVKKQRIQLQKQLLELVPLVQRFNLMAKQMQKRVECGLSIQYKYISEAEIVDVIKNNTYRSKLKVTIHVINHEVGRSYYWPVDIFKNRFQHALEMWDQHIKGNIYSFTKQLDPYWDPQSYQILAHAHITLQCLMFNLSFDGDIAIVKGGKKIGKARAKVYPTDAKGVTNLCIDGKGQNNTLKITGPHQQLQKTLFFAFEISNIELNEITLDFDSLIMQYQLLQGIKMMKHTSEIIFKNQLSKFKYRKIHTIKQVSQTTVIHYLQKPVAIQLQAIQKVAAVDQLTNRDSQSNYTESKGSFAIQLEGQDDPQEIDIKEFQEISPPKPTPSSASTSTLTPKNYHSLVEKPTSHTISPAKKVNSGVIYQNTDITKKVEEEYQRKKREQTTNYPNDYQVNMKKNKGSVAATTQYSDSKHKKSDKDKDCNIY